MSLVLLVSRGEQLHIEKKLLVTEIVCIVVNLTALAIPDVSSYVGFYRTKLLDTLNY